MSFLFSSRRRHTRCLSDWSSDVCSSDLSTELPVLVRLLDAREKSLALLFFRQMQEEFDDARVIAVKVALQVDDRTIAVVPNRFAVISFARQALAAQNLGMHAQDQHFLVV